MHWIEHGYRWRRHQPECFTQPSPYIEGKMRALYTGRQYQLGDGSTAIV
jgi:hypothetical protein